MFVQKKKNLSPAISFGLCDSNSPKKPFKKQQKKKKTHQKTKKQNNLAQQCGFY